MKQIVLLGVIVGWVLIVACGPDVTAEPTFTATATRTPKPTLTPTPMATRTPKPTLTPTPTPMAMDIYELGWIALDIGLGDWEETYRGRRVTVNALWGDSWTTTRSGGRVAAYTASPVDRVMCGRI